MKLGVARGVLLSGLAAIGFGITAQAATEALGDRPDHFQPLELQAVQAQTEGLRGGARTLDALLKKSAALHNVRPAQSEDRKSSPQAAGSSAGSFVYTKLFSPLKIEIKDKGYNLLPEDYAKFQALLDRLPFDDLKDIHEIDFQGGSVSGTSEPQPGTLVISQGGKNLDPYSWITEWDLAAAVGLHRFNRVLSKAERSEFDAAYLTAYDFPSRDLPWDFGTAYADYVYSSRDVMTFGVGDPDHRIASETLDARKDLPLALLLASAFAQGPNTGSFELDQKGNTARGDWPAYRTSDTIVVGPYQFSYLNNQVTGYFELGADGGPVRPRIVWTPPIDVPVNFISRLQQR